MKYCETYTSETAKVRPVRGWGALGGAGWGGGSSWSLPINAPKSSLIAFLSLFVISRIPAKPNPNRTHRFADLDAMISRKEGVGNPRSLVAIQQKGFRWRQREKISDWCHRRGRCWQRGREINTVEAFLFLCLSLSLSPSPSQFCLLGGRTIYLYFIFFNINYSNSEKPHTLVSSQTRRSDVTQDARRHHNA